MTDEVDNGLNEPVSAADFETARPSSHDDNQQDNLRKKGSCWNLKVKVDILLITRRGTQAKGQLQSGKTLIKYMIPPWDKN